MEGLATVFMLARPTVSSSRSWTRESRRSGVRLEPGWETR